MEKINNWFGSVRRYTPCSVALAITGWIVFAVGIWVTNPIWIKLGLLTDARVLP